MNIIEFLDEVGHTRLKFQILHQCIQNATATKGHTKVTFGTTEMSPNDVINLQRVGVVVWMDKADFDRASAAALGTPAQERSVDRTILDTVLPQAYEVINTLLEIIDAPLGEIGIRARRLLPAQYSESFAAQGKKK